MTELSELGWYHFRCFTDILEQDDMVEFLKTNCDVLVMVSEISKKSHRPHIHATIIPDKAISTFRDRLRKKFPQIFGNKSYSLETVRKYENNLKYCLKGTASDYPDILYTKLEKDVWKQYYNEYWLLQKQILDSKKSEVNMGCQNDPSGNSICVKKRVRVKTWSEKLTEHLITEHSGLIQKIILIHQGELSINRDEVYEYLIGVILKRLGKASKNLDDFILLRLYNSQYNAIIQSCGNEKVINEYNKVVADIIKDRRLFKF